MREMIDACKIFFGKSESKNHLGGLGTDGRIILKWISEKGAMSVNWVEVVQDRVQWWTSFTW
jgi:hypothetical protein